MRSLIVAGIIAISMCGFRTTAQIPAIELMGTKDKIKIPFNYYYNFIVVEVVLNGVLPMRLLLDTGAENTLIFERLYTDLIGSTYEREISIMGSDFSTRMNALITRRAPITFPKLGDTHMDVIVLKENLYHLEQFIGIDIHGILGSNMFNGLVVTIDYQREHIIIQRPENFQPPQQSFSLPIWIEKGKPYCQALTQCGASNPDTLDYLIDTGAGVSTMLHNNTHPSIRVPNNIISGNLGSGIGGFIKGYIGRIELFRIGPYGFKNVISTFQELDSTLMAQAEVKRNGLIGNQLLSRFDLTIDYAQKRMYLKPNSDYYDKFKVDRSGIFLVASGPNLNDYFIQDVLPNSPADRAGLMAGDKILSVNGLHVSFFTMSWLARRFQKDPGQRIRIKIRRKGKKLKKTFYLEDLI